MAESSVAVTVGAGTLLHSNTKVIGGNTVHDEIVGIGEPNLPSYICNFNNGGAAVSTATAAAHIVQIMAGASLKVRVRRIEIWQQGLATAATIAAFGIVRLTTAGTGGTAQSVSPLDPADSAAGATYMSLPTVKGTLGNFVYFGTGPLLQTVATGITQPQPVVVWDFDRPRSKPLIIAAGATNGIAVHNLVGIAGATVWVNAWIDETSWA